MSDNGDASEQGAPPSDGKSADNGNPDEKSTERSPTNPDRQATEATGASDSEDKTKTGQETAPLDATSNNEGPESSSSRFRPGDNVAQGLSKFARSPEDESEAAKKYSFHANTSESTEEVQDELQSEDYDFDDEIFVEGEKPIPNIQYDIFSHTEHVQDLLQSSVVLIGKHRRVVIFGRNGKFGKFSEPGLLNHACHSILSEVERLHQEDAGVWINANCNDKKIISNLKKLRGTKNTQQYIWRLRGYSRRDAIWRQQKASLDDTLCKSLVEANAWFVDIIDLQQTYKYPKTIGEPLIRVDWIPYFLYELPLSDDQERKQLSTILALPEYQPEVELSLYSKLENNNQFNNKIFSEIQSTLRTLLSEIEVSNEKRNSIAALIFERNKAKITMLIIAAFAEGMQIRSFNQLCQALLPDQDVPIHVLPTKLAPRPKAETFTWKQVWGEFSDEWRRKIGIVVSRQSREVQLSGRDWGDIEQLQIELLTQYSTAWSEVFVRALKIVPSLEVNTHIAGLKFILSAAVNESFSLQSDSDASLGKRIASVCVGSLNRSAGGRRLRADLELLAVSETKRGRLLPNVIMELPTVITNISTIPTIVSGLLAFASDHPEETNFVFETVRKLVLRIAKEAPQEDIRAMMYNQLDKDGRSIKQRLQWMYAFRVWLSSFKRIEQQFSHFIWEEFLHRDISYPISDYEYGQRDEGTLANVIYGPSLDLAKTIISCFLNIDPEVAYAASLDARERLRDLLLMTQQGVSEVRLENYPGIREKFDRIFLEEFFRDLYAQHNTFGGFVENLVTEHYSTLFDLFRAALLAEWRFARYGVINDQTTEKDRARIRAILDITVECASLEQRRKLCESWQLISDICRRYGRAAGDAGALDVEATYLHKSERLERMARWILKVN